MVRAKRMRLFVAILFVMAPLFMTRVKAQNVFLKNNILYDATLTPNIGAEVYIDSLWSVGIDAGMRIWPRSKWVRRKYRHLLIAPEVRRWLKHTGSGHFVGANILYTHYNIVGVTFPFGLYHSVKNKRKQGDAFALGPQYGYVWVLSDRWKLEAECGIDVGYAWYKEFNRDKPNEQIGKDNGIFAMPRLGVNIVYRIGSLRSNK